MEYTTLCYIKSDNKVLLLYRCIKENDINLGKWLGVGGHLEKNEDYDSCLLREVKEETGLSLTKYIKRGIIKFYYNGVLTEETHLYLGLDFKGKLIDCNEGILKWFNIDEIYNLPMWEGDKLFLKPLFENDSFINLNLYYEKDKLVKVE